MELREIDDPTLFCGLALNSVSSAEEAKVGLYQLPVPRLEVNGASPCDEAAVGRREADQVGHVIGPFERQCREAGETPTAKLHPRPSHVLLSAMGRRHPREARVRCRGETLSPSLAHARNVS